MEVSKTLRRSSGLVSLMALLGVRESGFGFGFGLADGEGEGVVVSTERVTVLLRSEPSMLALPAKSENAAEPTEITAWVVLPVLGVKEAV